MAVKGLIKGDNAMKKKYSGTAFLKMGHSCLENAPQSMLQLYIIITTWSVLNTHSEEESSGNFQLLNMTKTDFNQSLWNMTMTDLNQSNVLNMSTLDRNQSIETIGPFGQNCMANGGGGQNYKIKR